MSDDVNDVLKEIAQLLRRQIALQEAQAMRVERQLEIVRERPPLPDRTAVRDAMEMPRERPQRPDFTGMREAMDERMAKMTERAEQRFEEDREFRARLFAALERHNALIERLLDQRA